MFFLKGLKRSLDDHYDRDSSSRSRRDDFIGDDGRSRYSVDAVQSPPPRLEPHGQN